MNQPVAGVRSRSLAKPKVQSSELSVAEISGRIQRIQQVMRKVMLKDVHYGVVPGTPKPSLWKPGAEVLCTTFRIAPSFHFDNISDEDHYEFIVRCVGTHQDSGTVLGEGMGSASSNEKKYKWRAAVCDEEFDEADDSRKRVEWKKSGDGAYQVKQIRTEPADIVNTILKMACKRAHVAMTINVLAASDIFAQDLEDLPEGHIDQGGGAPGKPNTRPPRSTAGGKPLTEGQVRLVNARLKNKGVDAAALLAQFKIAKVEELPFNQVNEALAWIDAGGKSSSPATAPAESEKQTQGKPDTQKPQPKDADAKVTDSQAALLTERLQSAKLPAAKLCEYFGVPSLGHLKYSQVDAAIDWINANGA